ncbi:MAG: hypothetical protein H7328_11950 [Bdellovibrio sp.]|nr:hypothetical protein [Bdellovibrio sp.]
MAKLTHYGIAPNGVVNQVLLGPIVVRLSAFQDVISEAITHYIYSDRLKLKNIWPQYARWVSLLCKHILIKNFESIVINANFMKG